MAVNDNEYNTALMYLSMSLGSEDYLVYGYIGYCHIQLKNYDKAIMYLNKSVNLKDNDYLSRYYLGNTYFIMQVYDKALEHLSESVKLKDNDFDNWFALGLLYKVIDENDLSDECFEKARNIALDNNDIDEELDCFIKLTDSQNDEYLNYLYLGICYAKLESYKNAVHYLLESIEINEKYSNENNYLAYYWIGYINYVDSEYEDAAKYFEKSLSLNDEEENYLVLLWLGDCYFRLGNYKKALFNLKRSIELKDDEADTYKLISELYLKAGKKEKYNNYISKYKKLIKNINTYDNNYNYSKGYNNPESISSAFENNNKSENIYQKEEILNNEEIYSKKTDIEHFINLLFQDIEKNDLYNLYSSNTEKKCYIDFNDFNIDNYLSYRNIINNAVKDNFDNTNKITTIRNIITNFDIISDLEMEYAKKVIDDIEELFNHTSESILNTMHYYYKKKDIELYFILMKIIEDNL
ncbi:tetratricopeptide repeat protein [Brachyspira hyodysenteriae]|nr:tetratricopeptide repeat protein [Brachyspira hyodysenteriae]